MRRPDCQADIQEALLPMAKHNHLAAPCDAHTEQKHANCMQGLGGGKGATKIPSSHAICMKTVAEQTVKWGTADCSWSPDHFEGSRSRFDEAFLRCLVSGSDWTDSGPSPRLSKRCNDTLITEKNPAAAVSHAAPDAQSDTLAPHSE